LLAAPFNSFLRPSLLLPLCFSMARTQEFIPVVGEQDVDDLLPVSSSDVYVFLPLFSFPLVFFFFGRRGGKRWHIAGGDRRVFFCDCLSVVSWSW
jgi:hypothetical protein